MEERTYPLNEDIKALGRIFAKHGYKLYLVGGAVRDYLLGRQNDDYDFTTDARPEEVMALFPHHVIPTGLQHGTVTVRFRKQGYEVTTFRAEEGYSDSRHPDKVVFVRDLAGDLGRRDFTINAFAADCTTGLITDLHGGFEDLSNGLVRAIGKPTERFTEDALRMLRACRFASRLGFTLEEGTFEAMKALSGNITKISAERIREELFKTLMGPSPSRGVELMRQGGLLEHILPELMPCIGVGQGGRHRLDVYQHSLAALDAAADMGCRLEVRFAALMHDAGKPGCRRPAGDDRYSFHGHADASARIVDEVMQRLRCSNEERRFCVLLVKEHMFNYSHEWSDGAVRRFIAKVGVPNIPLLFQLRKADEASIDVSHSPEDSLEAFQARIDAEIQKKSALSLKDLAVNGASLAAIGVPKGPIMGKVLSHLLDLVLEDSSLNEEGILLDRARDYLASCGQ